MAVLGVLVGGLIIAMYLPIFQLGRVVGGAAAVDALPTFDIHLETLTSYGWPALVLLVWVGLAIGSFLNVVIYRLPVMLDRIWRGRRPRGVVASLR